MRRSRASSEPSGSVLVTLSPAFGPSRSAMCICCRGTRTKPLYGSKRRATTPAHSMIRGDLAAAYGFAGETERAAAELAEARRLSPDGVSGVIRKLSNHILTILHQLRMIRVVARGDRDADISAFRQPRGGGSGPAPVFLL